MWGTRHAPLPCPAMQKSDRFKGLAAGAMHAAASAYPHYAAPPLTLPPRGPLPHVSPVAANDQATPFSSHGSAKTNANPPVLGAFLRKSRYFSKIADFSVFTRLSEPFLWL